MKTRSSIVAAGVLLYMLAFQCRTRGGKGPEPGECGGIDGVDIVWKVRGL